MKQILSSVEILSQADLEKLHQATLDVLWTVGGRLPHPRVLKRMAEAGAQVNFDDGTVRLPTGLVEKALRETHTSEPHLEQTRVGDGPEAKVFFRRQNFRVYPGNEANIVDYGGTARRQGTQEDVIKGIVLTNELPFLESCMPLVTPSDVPDQLGDVYGYYLCALYSKKPFGVYLSDLFTAQTVLKMKDVVRREPARSGDDAQVNFLLEPNGSLSFNTPGLEIALAFTDAGQRISVGPMVMAGMDAPFSLAGALVVQNAENLLGLVMCHILGLPGSWSASVHTLDPRHTLCSFGSPNHLLLQVGAMQLGRFYGFNDFSLNLGLTDACSPDFQGGFEKGAGAMMALLAGAGGVGAQGIVGADQATSLEQLVIDNEWASYINHVFDQGFEINDDTLALDVIREVGIGGTYLAEEHTARHARKTYWRSTLFNQGSWDAWMSAGGKDIYTRAHERVGQILAEHYPPHPVIRPEAVAALDQIMVDAKEAAISQTL
jgi:trimethylamine--corrinoid protein Co-methyltransferase